MNNSGLAGIGSYFDSKNHRRLIIAEVAQTHEGSLGLAHSFIDAAAEAGADAIKFQTHIAEAESTPSEPFRIKFSKQDSNRYNYWKRMEFTPEQWKGLSDHATDRGLYFLSSPFSNESVDLLEKIGVPAWKIGSGETRNWPMLKKIAKTGKPIMLSSGMSSWNEISESVDFLKKLGAKFSLFQTTTMYPTPPEHLGLNVLAEMKKRFDCEVGLSDHSGSIYAGLAATTLGAKFIEVHVTLSRYMFGPDVNSSITIEDLKRLVEGVRFLEKAEMNPVNKDRKAEELSELKKIFGKSVVPARALPKGKILEESDLTLKKPASGIPADLMPSLLGKRIKRDLEKDEFFQFEDLENA